MLLFQGKAFGFYCNCIFLCFIILQASLVRLVCPEKQAKHLLNKQRLSRPQLNELSSVFQNMQSNFSMTIYLILNVTSPSLFSIETHLPKGKT